MSTGALLAWAWVPLLPLLWWWHRTRLQARGRAAARTACLPLAAALEAGTDALLVVDADGRVQAHNRRLLTLPGVTPALLQGGDADALLLAMAEAIGCAPALLQGQPGQAPAQAPAPLTLADGRQLTLRVSSWADSRGRAGRVLGWRIDDGESAARSLVEHLPIMASAWAADGRCVLASRTWRDGGAASEPEPELIQGALAGRMQSVERHHLQRDGSERHLWRLLVPHRVGARVIGCSEYVSDLTALKQAQRRLREQATPADAAAPVTPPLQRRA
ncbi:MAG: hypothetical protein U1F56_05605 [Rubrivivax sp.]